MTKQEFKTYYLHLKEIFGFGSRSWSELNESFCIYHWEANKRSIIAEYILLEEMVEFAESVDEPYYCGIDRFLRVYRHPVESVLN